MILQFLKDLNAKLPIACAEAESLTEVVKAIRDIPEHKRMVVSVRNSDSARDSLLAIAGEWTSETDPELLELYDYPIASAIIALADAKRDREAIYLSRSASCERSLEIASGIADSLLLQKALE